MRESVTRQFFFCSRFPLAIGRQNGDKCGVNKGAANVPHVLTLQLSEESLEELLRTLAQRRVDLVALAAKERAAGHTGTADALLRQACEVRGIWSQVAPAPALVLQVAA
jgi:hypothetical protein